MYTVVCKKNMGGKKNMLSPSLCTQKCKVKPLRRNDWAKNMHSKTPGILQSVPNTNTTKPTVCSFLYTLCCADDNKGGKMHVHNVNKSQ